MASLDIIIVNWNTSDALRECLTSIAAADNTGLRIHRVIVIDNDSTDALVDFTEWPSLPLQFIRNTRNRGFASACNQGAQSSKADYLLFLNPDTRLMPDALAHPIGFMEQAEAARIAVCGIRLTGMRGEPSLCCAAFPTALSLIAEGLGGDRLLPRIFPRRLLRSNDLPDSRTVDQIIGAFFLVRRAVFRALDGFDERFFLYFEEVDFSLRAKALGFDSFYLADVAAVHIGGLSSGRVKGKRLFYSLRSRIQFASKHFSRRRLVGLVLFTLLVEPLARIAWSCWRISAASLIATVKGYAELYNYLFQSHVLRTSAHGNSSGNPAGNHR
jgi:N-acetylglucosaminyl-diphospho-decaprenol L-rhamnosyltransferase